MDPIPPLVMEQLDRSGYVVCSLLEHSSIDLDAALSYMKKLLSSISHPIQVFDKFPEWRPIGVALSREPNRSEGVGTSPLHIDFVNAEDPPDYVLLYCERGDPAGGGESTLAPTAVAGGLPEFKRQQLREPCFVDGRVVNLHNIGRDINPFAVLPKQGKWRFRYTGQLMKAAMPEDAAAAISALSKALASSMVTVTLEDGDALIIDQHKAVHGRLPLGLGQEGVNPDQRRLLWQRFGRRTSLDV